MSKSASQSELAGRHEFADFAKYYDLSYANKDYDAEVELFDALVSRFAEGGASSVLDAGCGTGEHSLRLAKRGYRVTGVDRSKNMLDIARGKPQPEGTKIEWIQQDLQSLALEERFDLCGAFFAVLSFQISNHEMARALTNIHRHLKPGGLLLADLWYGPAVLSEGPEPRLKTLETRGKRILKYSTPELDTFHHTNTVHQHLIVLDEEDRQVAEIRESQKVRFWFPQEISALLERQGFEVVHLFAYPDPDRAPTTADWDLGLVARAR